MTNFAKLVPIPHFDAINIGLSPAHQTTMLNIFGPPGKLTTDCSDITNAKLEALVETRNIGPFKVTGLGNLLDQLVEIFTEVKQKLPDVFQQVHTDGMLCVRAVHGASVFSNHSWGSAIDIRFGDDSDEVGDGLMQLGCSALAPFFQVRGWYWGVGFGQSNPKREDSMHFEASDELIRKLYGKDAGLFDPTELRKDQPSPLEREMTDVIGGVLKAPMLASDAVLEAIADGHGVLAASGSLVPSIGLVQDALNLLAKNNPDLTINLGTDNKFRGFFGEKTETAVEAFQTAAGLDADGRVGKDTILALDKALQTLGSRLDTLAIEPTEGAAEFPIERGQPVGDFKTPSSSSRTTDGKGGSKTTGLQGEIFRPEPNVEIIDAIETVTAFRDGHSLGQPRNVRQVLEKRDGVGTVHQADYCWGKRSLPDASLVDDHPGFGTDPSVFAGKATFFGKGDTEDEGTGSPAFGTVQTDSSVFGISLKKSKLLKEGLVEVIDEVLHVTDKGLRALVEVYFPSTRRLVRLPLVDQGPGETIKAVADLTVAASAFLQKMTEDDLKNLDNIQVQARIMV
jgi:hypothetical protein